MTGFADQLFNRPASEWAFLILALLIAIPIHEYAHALAAQWAGDDTATRQGRVSLDPLKHLDPLGTILILIGGFGWGKPVPVNPYKFRRPRWDSLIVSAAGPGANLLLALLIGGIGFRLQLLAALPEGYLHMALRLIALNLGLACFNLIPVPPLDGSKILMSLLPTEAAYRLAKLMDQYGLLLLFVLMLTNWVDKLLHLPVIWLLRLFTGL